MAIAKRKNIWTQAVTPAVALQRCRDCDHLGAGKCAGKCRHHRINGVYPPIWAVAYCPAKGQS